MKNIKGSVCWGPGPGPKKFPGAMVPPGPGPKVSPGAGAVCVSRGMAPAAPAILEAALRSLLRVV